MMWILLILVLGIDTLNALQICNSSSIAVNYTDTTYVVIDPGSPVNLTLVVPSQIEPVDMYFLFEISYRSRKMFERLWQTGQFRLFNIMTSMLALNPNMRFGLGFFTTKRVAGVGRKHGPPFPTYTTDFVFRPIVPITININLIDSNMITQQWVPNSFPSPMSNITSSVEALMHLIINADTNPQLGFRPGSRRIVVLGTCQQPGLEGDLRRRVLSPVTQYPELVSYPRANDHDGDLEADCVLRDGLLCPDSCGLVQLGNPDNIPNVACGCALKGNLSVSVLNSTQFLAGSCEDFPSLSGAVSAMSAMPDFELIAFVPNVMISGSPTDYSKNRNSAFFGNLISLLGGGGYVINNTVNLAPYLVGAYPPTVAVPVVSFLPWQSEDIYNYTLVGCNVSVCVFVVTFNTPGITNSANGTGNFTILIGDNEFDIDIDECYQPNSTQSMSDSFSGSKSNSKSASRSLSASKSNSKSASHSLSASKSNSNSNSKSNSQSTSRSPSASKSNSKSNSHSLSASKSNSKSASLSLSASKSNSKSNSHSLSASKSNSKSNSHSLSASKSNSKSASLSLSASKSNSKSNSHSLSASKSDSKSNSHSLSASKSNSKSASLSPSASKSNSKSNSHSLSASKSNSKSNSHSLSASKSNSKSNSHSLSASKSNSKSNSHSLSASKSNSKSASQSLSASKSQSKSHSISQTPSETPVPTPTFTKSISKSKTASPAALHTDVPHVNTPTPSNTPIPTDIDTTHIILIVISAVIVFVVCVCIVMITARRKEHPGWHEAAQLDMYRTKIR